MSRSPTLSTLARWLLLPGFVASLTLAGCQCVDQAASEKWQFDSPDDTGADILVDTEPPPPDTIPPPDTFPPQDTRDVEIDTWQPENVVSDVKCADALNDRTSLIVDRKGTTWVGFHKFRSDNCNRQPTLVVARKPLGGNWTEEDIQPHTGIFGLSSINPGKPIVVYPDGLQNGTGQFRAAHRESFRDWRFHNFDIGDFAVQGNDGFDVTEDGESFWVTFARDGGQMVQLFEYDTTRSNPRWEGRASLNIPDPRPALARGLRAGPGDSVYLVHRNDNTPGQRYGIARYDKTANAWPNRAYLDDIDANTTVHSFIRRQNGELCLSNHQSNHLLVTCGTMSDLDARHEYFPSASIENIPPTSITEGKDGTLYVAFHPPNQSKLKLAKKEPGGTWETQTIYDDSASAVSTAIDRTGDLVLAFYTQPEPDRYALKVLRERPDQL